MKALLVLRPPPGNEETARRARDMGLSVHCLPLFQVEPLAWKPPPVEGYDGILLTSANAVRHAGPGLERLLRLPVHAVGSATAEAAAKAGFDVESVGSEGVDSLLRSVAPGTRLLHLCGAHRHESDSRDHSIDHLPVYVACATSPSGLAEAARGRVVLLHSTRAARRLDELLPDGATRASVSLAAISGRAAAAAGRGWQQIAVADRPSDDALLALALSLCEEKGA